MKKTTIIFISIALGILALIGGWFVFQALTTENDSPLDAFESTNTSPFFPSGNTTTDESPVDTTNTENPFFGENTFISRGGRFRLLHTNPTAGATFVPDREDITIRFIEKETGHIFETSLENPTVQRLTNTTIPHIQEVLWGNTASSTIIRYIDDSGDVVKTFLGTIVMLETPENTGVVGELIGTFLEDTISFLTISPDSEEMFYLTENTTGSTGILYTFKNATTKNIFTTPLTELIPQWTSDRTILLTTQPAYDIFGYTYRISNTGGSFSKVLGPARGLVSLGNSTFSTILYSQNSSLFSYNVAKATSVSLGLSTLPDKCVWSIQSPHIAYCAVPKSVSNTTFPEEWYQGRATTNDTLWRINTTTGVSTILFDPESEGVSLDIENLTVNTDDTHLLLQDRKNKATFVLKIEE